MTAERGTGPIKSNSICDDKKHQGTGVWERETRHGGGFSGGHGEIGAGRGIPGVGMKGRARGTRASPPNCAKKMGKRRKNWGGEGRNFGEKKKIRTDPTGFLRKNHESRKVTQDNLLP